MFRQLSIGAFLTALTVLVHAIGTTFWLDYLLVKYGGDFEAYTRPTMLGLLIGTSLFVFILHLIEVVIWAATYRFWTDDTDLRTFEEAFYFSMVTFTTLGFGDIIIKSRWRILSGTQAIAGLLINGWSAAFMFAMISEFWRIQLLR